MEWDGKRRFFESRRGEERREENRCEEDEGEERIDEKVRKEKKSDGGIKKTLDITVMEFEERKRTLR